MSLYNDSAAGTLEQPALDNYCRTLKIDGPSEERGNGTLGLTPLALAARNGHAKVVKLLLDNHAAVDALSSQDRTALWIVTSRGRGDDRAEIVDLLLKHHANVKYSHPNLHSGSTPLANELNQLKDPEVIQLLVENGGTTEEATKLAAELGEEIGDAMKSTAQRRKLRATIVDLIAALVLFILAWANSAAVTGMANKIFNKFQISGDKESATAKKIAAEVPEPKTKEDFKNGINTFVKKHKLHKFFPTEDDPLLETLVSKAMDLQNDDNSVLGQSTNAENLVNFALYQPVIYCDDSGSMNIEVNKKEDRMADQRNLVRMIASICTKVVPDKLGVHLRFINQGFPNANDLRADAIEEMMSRAQPLGYTEIGTNLRKRILEPLVYNTTMARPLFVSIITDGSPGGPDGSPEKKNTLRDEIIKCQEYLLANGRSPRSVIFQISQIGSDTGSKAFLDALNDDPRLQSVYVTAQQLDSRFRELRGNERKLEAWLFKTLLKPVLDIRSD